MAYRKTPLTERRRDASRTRFLFAARALFADRGYGATTTRAIVEEAGGSMGNLYFYFPDKEAILRTLVEDAVDDAARAVDEAIARVPAGPPQLAVAVLVGVETMLARTDLARIIFVEAPRSGLRAEAIAHFAARVRRHFAARPAAAGSLPPDLAAAAWVGALWQTVEQALTGDAALDARALGLGLARWNLRATGLPVAVVEEAVRIAEDAAHAPPVAPIVDRLQAHERGTGHGTTPA